MNGEKVLLVDDETIVLDSLSEMLRAEGFEADTARTNAEALFKLKNYSLDVIIADVHLPDGSGLELLRMSRELKPDVPVILISGYDEIRDAVAAIKMGAMDFLIKPVSDARLLNAVREARESHARYRRDHRPRRRIASPQLEGLVTNDYRMLRIGETIMNVADSNANVLIQGESGVGKTLIAKLLHRHSSRCNGPFVEISCAAMPEGLLESELFGHVKGAFTSAYQDREGKFKAADSGTIFLDEIASASKSLQMRLLQVAQEAVFTRVGDNNPIHVDVRILAAANRPLDEEVAEGRFREDLFHRLNVIQINVPPLRERVRDIPLLSDLFVAELAAEHHRAARPISEAVMLRLVRYRWPGNVRELRNVLEHGVIMASGEEIELRDLPAWIMNVETPDSGNGLDHSLREALQEPERRLILGALKLSQWNKRLAASRLKVSRSTLYNKIREHQLLQGSQ